MTLRSSFFLLLTLMRAQNMWSLIPDWPGVSTSEASLRRMGVQNVELAFQRDVEMARRSRANGTLIDDFRVELALDRCGAYLNWLSKSRGGPHGRAFLRQCISDLREQLDGERQA